MKRLALTLMLLAAPAIAQEAPVESVTVHGSSLAGVWHGGLLQYVGMGIFSAPEWDPTHDGFCRIAPRKGDLEISCLQLGLVGTVTSDDDHVHFAWGTMMLRLVLDGELVSAGHLRGHFQTKVLGISHENPAFSEALRVTPDPSAPDKAGKAALLRRILGEGLAGVPQDVDAMKKNRATLSPPKLGAIQSIIYLGQETKWGPLPPPNGKPNPNPDRPDFFSVYLVSFADGERLCGLHQREDGVLDAFDCV